MGPTEGAGPEQETSTPLPGGEEAVSMTPGGEEPVTMSPGGEETVTMTPGGEEPVTVIPGGEEDRTETGIRWGQDKTGTRLVKDGDKIRPEKG